MTSPTSSTSSVSGLASGIDTSSIISQLMQIEANPQNLLKQQLIGVQTDGAAYRDVNSAFAALASAAASLTQASTWSAVKASSSASSVTASATNGATPGSLTFTVAQLATAHSVMANKVWTNATDAYGLGSTLTIKSTNGATTFGAINVTSSTTGPASLNDAVTAINKSGLGLSATTIKTSSGYALQVTSNATGAAKAFQIDSDTDPTGSSFGVATQGQDAQISIPNPTNSSTPYTSTSATNTFTDVMAGTSFTVSQQGVTATVGVASDPSAVTKSVQGLVDAANNVLGKIAQYTDSSSGSTAPLKGDWSLISLTGRVLDAVSSAVGNSSAASAGLQLDRYGKVTFDSGKFASALAANPAQVQAIFGGTVGPGADNVPNTSDDTIATDGISARLQILATQASDSATGSLTGLANGEDTRATDLQAQIADWDTRLALRKQTLTTQFNAMETALGTLKSQASWLTSQINSLPTISSSSK